MIFKFIPSSSDLMGNWEQRHMKWQSPNMVFQMDENHGGKEMKPVA